MTGEDQATVLDAVDNLEIAAEWARKGALRLSAAGQNQAAKKAAHAAKLLEQVAAKAEGH